jgi:plastocyanin
MKSRNTQRRGVSKTLPVLAIVGALIVGLGSGIILTLATFGVAGTTTIVLTRTTTEGSISYNYTGSITRDGPSTAQVRIQNTAFNPVFITVVIGVNNTVVWTNYDQTTHTVTDDNGTFNSGNLNGGQSWSFTFTSPGTYYYHCIYHSVMNAVVIVAAEAT